jgi:hypothetical protein
VRQVGAANLGFRDAQFLPPEPRIRVAVFAIISGSGVLAAHELAIFHRILPRHSVRTSSVVPTIACSPAMWRFVRAWRSAGDRPVTEEPTILGPWAATVVESRRCQLVLAVDLHACLTLLFELEAEATFAAAWKNALTSSLRELGVARPRIAHEIASGGFRLKPLSDDRSAAMLSAVEFVCETELHYQPDLSVVQRRLNEFPHDRPPDYAPMIAIKRLFGVRT